MKITANISNNLVIKEIGSRIKQHRISSDMTQIEFAKKTGISLRNIVRIENGEDTNIKNIIKILEVFGIVENLNVLIPDYDDRPMYKIKKYKIKKRVRVKNNIKENRMKWGDEK